MAYNTVLEERMRPYLLARAGVSDKRMFGGLGFLIHGNMCCGIWKDSLIVRLSVEGAAKALKQKHVRVFDVTGKPMRGWFFVDPAGYKRDADLYSWIDQAFAFASSLPKKAQKHR